jgi:flagellar motor component MotA
LRLGVCPVFFSLKEEETMDLPIFSAILTTAMGIFISVLTALITHKLKQFDENAVKYRKQREEK